MSILESLISQNYIGWVVIAIIVAMLAWGIVLCLRIKKYYNDLTVDFKENQYTKSEERFKSKQLNIILEKFKISSTKGTENINTEVIIEKNLDGNIIKNEGRVSLLPAFSTALGLLGTFLGLTLAIFQTKTALNGIENINNFTMALQNPIASMSSAFWTSIFGVIASIILNSLRVEMLRVKTNFYDCIEDYLDNEVYADHANTFNTIFDEFSKTVKITMLTLTEEMKDLFQNGVEELVNKINKNSIDLTESASALQEYTREFETLVETFDKTVENFVEPVDKFKGTVENFEIISGELNNSFKENFNDFNGTIDQTLVKINDKFNDTFGQMNNSFNITFETMNENMNINSNELKDSFNKLNDGFVNNVESLSKILDKSVNKFDENIIILQDDFKVLGESIRHNNENNNELAEIVKQESTLIKGQYNLFEESLDELKYSNELQNQEFLNKIAAMNSGYIQFKDGMKSFEETIEKIEPSIVEGFTDVVRTGMDGLSKDCVKELQVAIKGVKKATEDLSGSINIIGELVKATNEWVATAAFTMNEMESEIEYEGEDQEI